MKTKQQKQLEALERKRGLYSAKLDQYLGTQYGTKDYSDFEARWGAQRAQQRSEDGRRTFEKYLREARLDSHGNPL